MTRLLLTDVTVTRNAKTITCNMRLQGGQDHTLTLPVPKIAWELTPPHIVEAIDELLDHHTHAEIAAILNAGATPAAKATLPPPDRPQHPRRIPATQPEQRLRDTGMLTLEEMAPQLSVSTSTVKAWVVPQFRR